MATQEIFGAFASVRILFKGDLHSLAGKVSSALNIGEFNIESKEHPPHHEVGSAEALGCELWLEKAKSETDAFNLRLETEHAVEEVFQGRMHDLSPWLARFLSMMCNFDVVPMSPDSES